MKTIFFTALCLASPLPAADGPNFADDILPILRTHCVNCHRPGKTRAGLDLTTVETIEKGGSSGASVQPGGHREATLYGLATGDGSAPLVNVAQKTSPPNGPPTSAAASPSTIEHETHPQTPHRSRLLR